MQYTALVNLVNFIMGLRKAGSACETYRSHTVGRWNKWVSNGTCTGVESLVTQAHQRRIVELHKNDRTPLTSAPTASTVIKACFSPDLTYTGFQFLSFVASFFFN